MSEPVGWLDGREGGEAKPGKEGWDGGRRGLAGRGYQRKEKGGIPRWCDIARRKRTYVVGRERLTQTIPDLATARRLLGEDSIIGVTVSNVEEMLEACRGGADYLGIGTVFATAT